MKMIQGLGLMMITGLAGCAHSAMRGTVAMKANNEEAHVCLGDNEVKAGDKVVLFKNVCVTPRAAGRLDVAATDGGCKKVALGGGIVERTLNEHYSVVKVDPGTPFEEGTIVEKQ